MYCIPAIKENQKKLNNVVVIAPFCYFITFFYCFWFSSNIYCASNINLNFHHDHSLLCSLFSYLFKIFSAPRNRFWIFYTESYLNELFHQKEFLFFLAGSLCLYDIPSDSCEENDLAKFFPSVVRRMKRALVDYKKGLIPQQEIEIDIENANPKLFKFTWNPWLECANPDCELSI